MDTYFRAKYRSEIQSKELDAMIQSAERGKYRLDLAQLQIELVSNYEKQPQQTLGNTHRANFVDSLFSLLMEGEKTKE